MTDFNAAAVTHVLSTAGEIIIASKRIRLSWFNAGWMLAALLFTCAWWIIGMIFGARALTESQANRDLLAFATVLRFTISSMVNLTLRQGDVIAKLSKVRYRPDEGFQEDNTWQVAEASISVESDTKLRNGPATILYEGREFPVTVSVFELEMVPGQEDGEDESACTIEIACAEGLPTLAHALRLL
jgi:hypothetical protein